MKVTVITPTTTLNQWLFDAIESVKCQITTCMIEHVVVVDDKDVGLPPDVQSEKYQVVFIYNVNRRGVSGARNSGLDVAGGSIVFFLDSDDLWSPNYIQTVIETYRIHSDIDCIASSGICFGDKLKRASLASPYILQGVISSALVCSSVVGHPSGFSFLRGSSNSGVRFVESINFMEDHLFYVELMLRGARFWKQNKVLFWYRISPLQTTRRIDPAVVSDSTRRFFCYLRENCPVTMSIRQRIILHVQVHRLALRLLKRASMLSTLALALVCSKWVIAEVLRYFVGKRL